MIGYTKKKKKTVVEYITKIIIELSSLASFLTL